MSRTVSTYVKHGVRHVVAFVDGFGDIIFTFTASCGDVLSTTSRNPTETVARLGDDACVVCRDRAKL